MQHVRTPLLDISFAESGPADGDAVILLHGFPYSFHCYDAVAAILAADGHRVLVPELRGYGDTRFLRDSTLRSGQQAALGHDLRDFMDALNIESAILAGYDWGGRAACVVAALWPERVRGLVTGNGYNIQNIAASGKPAKPDAELRLWYQHYFQTARGRDGLAENCAELTRLLWMLWSPPWRFGEADLAATIARFDTPDFVDVVIHSYRHRFAAVAGDPAYDATERALAQQPTIAVPTIAIQGADDGVNIASASEGHARHFGARYERRLLHGVGHNPPQEAPALFAQAVRDVCA